MSEAYNIKQIAEKLKISISSVKRLINDGKLKAHKFSGKGYIINEISLLVFLGNNVEDCINREQFEDSYTDWNKMYNGKVDKEKFFKYYCSLFTPGPDLKSDYFLIKDKPLPEPESKPVIEDEQSDIPEQEKSQQIILSKSDIIGIIESLNKIQKILQDKI